MQEAIQRAVGKRPLRPWRTIRGDCSKDGRIIATGTNSVTAANDPTAQAEVNAIREACRALGAFQLTGCEIYTSLRALSHVPRRHLLGAAGQSIFSRATAGDAAEAGFDDSFIYEELKPFTRSAGFLSSR